MDKMDKIIDKTSFSNLLFHTACVMSVLGTLIVTAEMASGEIVVRNARAVAFLPFALLVLFASFVVKFMSKKMGLTAPPIPVGHYILLFLYCLFFISFLVLDLLIIRNASDTTPWFCSLVLYVMVVNSIFYIVVLVCNLKKKLH